MKAWKKKNMRPKLADDNKFVVSHDKMHTEVIMPALIYFLELLILKTNKTRFLFVSDRPKV